MQNKLADSATSSFAVTLVEKLYDVIDWATSDIEPTDVYMLDDSGEYQRFKVKCHYCMFLRGAIYGCLITGAVAGVLFALLP